MKSSDAVDRLITSPEYIEELIRLISQSSSSVDEIVSQASDADAAGDLIAQIEQEIASGELSALEGFVNGRREPCLLVRATGEVIGANNAARVTFGAMKKLSIDELGISQSNGESLVPLIARLAQSHQKDSRYRTGRASCDGLDQTVPVVMVTVPKVEPDAPNDVLILLGKAPELSSPYARSFLDHDLSPSEIDVVEQFIAGKTLGDIAQARGRSVATVRKQFYTICEKFGVTSQAELLRAIYQDASVIADVGTVIEQTQHPDRVEAKVLRPGGRTVEVIVAGDMAGYPVVLVPSPSLRAWPARIERAFKEARIQMITVVGPGFGASSHPHKDHDRVMCMAEDVVAVLDQLGQDKALLFTSNFGLKFALTLTAHAPERFSKIFVQSLSISRTELKERKSSIGILANIQSVLGKPPHFMELAMRAAGRSFQAMSPKTAIKMIHRKNQRAIDSFLDPENYPEVALAAHSIFAQGTEAASDFFLASQSDWSDEIRACKVPITLVAGVGSDLHELSDLQSFAARYPDNIRFEDVSAQDIATPYEMVDMIIEAVAADRGNL